MDVPLNAGKGYLEMTDARKEKQEMREGRKEIL